MPPAIVQRLGMTMPELQALHAALTRVIARRMTRPQRAGSHAPNAEHTDNDEGAHGMTWT